MARPVRVSRAPEAALGRLVQPMLTVGAANDPLEHEAERTAERITTMSAPPAPPAEAGPPRPGAARLLSRTADSQPSLDQLETDPPLPTELQEPTVAPAENVPMNQVDPGDIAEISAGRPADAGNEQSGGGEVQPLRRAPAAAVGPEGGAAPREVAARVASPGAGRPLPPAVAGFMEPRFGVSFAHVRLHDQPADREAAARIGARAFTHGSHIWLGPSERAEDRRLLAHELTHVIQQTGPRPLDAQPLRAERIRRLSISEEIENIARYVPGYSLLSVILGRSPITGQSVPRTAENLIGGVLGLIPGGTILVERLRESHAIQQAYDWVSGRLSELNITWDRVSTAIGELLSLRNAFSPRAAIRRYLGPILDDLGRFALDLKDKLQELIVKGALALAGPRAEQVWGVFREARDSIGLVLDDPLRFARNLFSAVGRGFGQFGHNILEHLRRGMMGWLFGALGGAGIQMPERLDLKGIMSIGLQVVGLTWRHFRGDLVRELEPHGEVKVGFMERAVGVIRTLITEGFAGVWRKMLELIDGFKQTVLGGIKTFVTQTIITQAITWLASLTNPIGGIVRILKAAYDIVTVFLERLQQIMELARSIFSSIGAIARGNIEQAANFVEQTMGRTVPIIISFMAGLLGLGGISGQIRNVIARIQAPVTRARMRLVGFLVKKAKQLISRIIARLNRARRGPSVPFQFMGVQHRMFSRKTGARNQLYVASNEMTAEAAGADGKTAIEQSQGRGDDNPAANAAKTQLQAPLTQAAAATAAVQPENTTTNQRRAGTEAEARARRVAAALTQASQELIGDPYIDPRPSTGFIRAIEPRPTLDGQPVEGRTATYRSLKRDVLDKTPRLRGRPMSVYYERDHLPGKAILFALRRLLTSGQTFAATPGTTGPGPTAARPTAPSQPGAPQPAPVQAVPPSAAANPASPIRIGPPVQAAPGQATPGQAAPAQPAAPTTAASPAATQPAGTNAAAGPPEFGPLLTAAATATGEDLYAIVLYRPIHNRKPTLDDGAATSLITQAAGRGTTRASKVAAVRQAIRGRIEQEISELVGIYNGDTSATADVRASARVGLTDILRLNEAFEFKAGGAGGAPAATAGAVGAGLAASPQTPANLQIGTSRPSTARDMLSAAQVAAEKGEEATVNAYRRFGTRGDHTEADHVLDKAYPLSLIRVLASEPNSARRKFGDPVLTSALRLTTDALLPPNTPAPARAAADARLAALKAKDFRTADGPMPGDYSEGLAQTMLLYRPLAARVTAQTRTSNAWGEVVGTLGEAHRSAIRAHILGTMPEATMRGILGGPIQGLFRRQFERHIGVISGEYHNEIRAMIAINPPGPMRAAATAYGDTLRQRIATGRDTIRADVDRPF